MISVLFFGQLREQLNTGGMTLDDNHLSTVSDIINYLMQDNTLYKTHLSRPNLLIAVNQEYATLNTNVSSGDEVAFFPPVTGG